MPRLDAFHVPVRQALVADGWNISGEQYRLIYGGGRGHVDIAAEQLIAAQQGRRKIAVEVKNFRGLSPTTDLHGAVGQYLVYRSWMHRLKDDRELWLAVSTDVAKQVFDLPFGQVVLEDYAIDLLVVDIAAAAVAAWRSR